MAEQNWSKVEKTKDLVDYVYVQYGNNGKESDEFSDEMLDNLYNYAMLKGFPAEVSNLSNTYVLDSSNSSCSHYRNVSKQTAQ
ncbi:hypothetical protein Tco_0778884 [Tanacetum coccineum]